MIATDLRAFVRANLPEPPIRVFEVGAGSGALARALTGLGYDVLAIDPEPGGPGVTATTLDHVDEPPASFDAAIAVLSLHHVDPLEESCSVLGELLKPGAPLLVDEFDVARLDGRAADWWLEQRRSLGEPEELDSEEFLARHQAHLHPLPDVCAALEPYFDVGAPVRGAYLYRWNLSESLRAAEEELIARGRLPAVGARLVLHRR